MNKFQKLAQLNQDIELLENAGKFKAAEVLQRKFVREAQEYTVKPAQELMNEIFLTAQNPTNEYNDLIAAYNINRGSYSSDEQGYIAKAIERANKQRLQGTFSTSVQPNNPTVPAYSTAPLNPQSAINQVPNSGIPTQTGFVFENTSKNYNPSTYTGPIPNGLQNTEPTAPIGRFSDQVQLELADIASQQQASPVYSDLANDVQAQNTMPAESSIYQQAINQIAKLLQAKNPMSRTMAQSIFDQTVVQFQDARRKKAFANQFQRLISTNFPAGPIQ